MDKLWEEHPRVQQICADSEIQTLRKSVVTVVKARFPALEELAQQKVARIDKADVMNLLLEQVSAAPNEEMVRWLLHLPAA